jgi:soluble epoxide hydrolase / lipid-phosphate phosphatase
MNLAAKLPSNPPPGLPVLMVWGTKDFTMIRSAISNARKFIVNVQDVALEGRGHWILWEAKDEVSERVANWLQGLISPKL